MYVLAVDLHRGLGHGWFTRKVAASRRLFSRGRC